MVGPSSIILALVLASQPPSASVEGAVRSELEVIRNNIGSFCGNNAAAAHDALVALGPPAVPFLLSALDEDRTGEVPGAAAHALMALDQPALERWCRSPPERLGAQKLCARVFATIGARQALVGRWVGALQSSGGLGSRAVAVSLSVEALHPIRGRVCFDVPMKCAELVGSAGIFDAKVTFELPMFAMRARTYRLSINEDAPNRISTWGDGRGANGFLELERLDLGTDSSTAPLKEIAEHFFRSPGRLRPDQLRPLLSRARSDDHALMVDVLEAADDVELPWIAPWFAAHPSERGLEALSKRLGTEYVMKSPLTLALAEAGDATVLRWALRFVKTEASARWVAYQVIARSPRDEAREAVRAALATRSADGLLIASALLHAERPRWEDIAGLVELSKRYPGLRERVLSDLERLAHRGHSQAEILWSSLQGPEAR